ncbi:polysaccharide pyruvyl transferase family protein [Ensifer sp. ENS02]|uniref:polysaccharide pyruvyl transferase family protein n=1 Tax=Ensifer sp. ENS02 TaxID=2769290 RepID=UPI000DDAF73E|nr:polysaccharide pyruvyl transferase family protein [Ensifer sp. ENS02]MBD9520731.1 polysaccharide pyruvyl transferase family protein [Ensifer sp. ENS02]
MFVRPLVIGVPSLLDNEKCDNMALLKRLGGNSGNMLFTEALLRLIVGSKWQPNSLHDADGDCVVVAAANWLNPGDDFGWLADEIEKSRLPAFIVGIGAQSSLRKEIPRIEPGTVRLLKVVAERSGAISTRGPFSSEVLEHYGIKNSVPTGCPSLLLCGPQGPAFNKGVLGPQIVLHGTRHGNFAGGEFQSYFYRQAFALKKEILLQSELVDLEIATGIAPYDIEPADAHMVNRTYAAGPYPNLVQFLRTKAAFFYNLEKWISYARKKDFFVGTRIHATVLSLIAGTPAVLIAHDSRTEELAEVMGVPYVRPDKIDTNAPLDCEGLFEIFKNSDFGKYRAYRTKFLEFFRENGFTASNE